MADMWCYDATTGGFDVSISEFDGPVYEGPIYEGPIGEGPIDVPEAPGAKPHGDNGWGNGADGDNPGTPKGNAEQAGTKQNHFVSDKFLFKFDGR